MAVTSEYCPRCIAGMTLTTPMLAVLMMPQRTFSCRLSAAFQPPIVFVVRGPKVRGSGLESSNLGLLTLGPSYS